MTGDSADRILGVAVSDDDETVRIAYSVAGEDRFVDFPARQLNAMIPALAQASTPRGYDLDTWPVADLRGFLGLDNRFCLSIDLSNGARIVLTFDRHLAVELLEVLRRFDWASQATGPKN